MVSICQLYRNSIITGLSRMYFKTCDAVNLGNNKYNITSPSGKFTVVICYDRLPVASEHTLSILIATHKQKCCLNFSLSLNSTASLFTNPLARQVYDFGDVTFFAFFCLSIIHNALSPYQSHHLVRLYFSCYVYMKMIKACTDKTFFLIQIVFCVYCDEDEAILF